ncbi:mechanosensitive ion channel domain-containing protein [Methylomonas methanica]|uniref:MscS Mechanosensitive ion channel n=1 Tax=Methylomonas methanica (strain DSM 25384 / MC09) TaxID=857087 RepID=G0A414_METMM|nr:mechanosensitive ion channel domain-containing protein [Methylomonas methanica]AEF99061.1 MscS Mechanosensitive ion channel [Methylomonas methanica MC09]
MSFNTYKYGFALGLIAFFISVNPAWAGNQKQLVKSISLEEIQQRIESIKARQNLSEELKNRILAAYQESEDNLTQVQRQENLAEDFKRSTRNLPLDSKQLQSQISEIASLLKQRKSEKLSSLPVDELEQRLVLEKTKLSDLDAEIAKNEGLITELTNAPQAIREKTAEIKAKQLATQQEQQQLVRSTNTENLLEKEARQIQLETRLRLFNSTLKTLGLESISDPLQLQLQKDRTHLLNLQRERQMLQISELEGDLLERRQQEIDKEQLELLQAEKDAEGKNPLIREATKENMHFNRDLQKVNENIERYQAKKNELDARSQQIDRDFQSAEQKITLAGLSPALGNLLREQRRNLPQRKQYNSLNEEIQMEIASASLEMFKLDEAKKRLMDVSQALLNRLERKLPADIDPAEALRIRTELRMLLNDQKDLVGRLSSAYSEYARLLGDVDFVLQQMLNAADKFGAYLDERLLWVPSAPVISQAYLSNIVHSAMWFFAPSHWLHATENLLQGLQAYPVLLLALVMAIVVLYWRYRRALKQRLQETMNKCNSNQYLVSFSQTLNSLGIILLLSMPVALLMIWTAWVMTLATDVDPFSRAVSTGLIAAAVPLAILQFFYRMLKPKGLAEMLFHWQKRSVQLLYSQIKWSRFVIIPAVFIIGMANTNLFSEQSHALGRTALIILMVTMSYVFHRYTHPLTGLAKSFYAYSNSWLSNFRYVWYLIVTLVPWVVIGFAVMGYYQSALELESKLIVTLRLVFATALFHALVLRWLTVTKRQLALQNARQKRKQADQVNVNTGAEGAYVPEETLLDLSKINQQSNKLLTTSVAMILIVGTWMIWKDILPAFSIFDRIELWQYSDTVDGKETVFKITLINLLVSFFYIGLTVVFVSNFPGLVDLMSAGKFSMTAGSRYALIQLVRYLLVSIAFLAIANELGGSWSQVQWLVAALSVGLGFGLQEIFANLVSGIILLFERPIRVGDTVTVGDVTGRVCRIQMRATHIIDWDMKELVVPNKNIITERLVNWTLTDTVTRVVLMIGVGYGSDVELVERVLKEVINSVESVLPEPEPSISFMTFGESSLDFRVCVFVRELGQRIPVIHELHKKFYVALGEHQIEIPFPQRDIHVRSVAEGVFSA